MSTSFDTALEHLRVLYAKEKARADEAESNRAADDAEISRVNQRLEEAVSRIRRISESVGRDYATDRADDDIEEAARQLKLVPGSIDEQVRALIEALRMLRIDANRVCDKLHGENRSGDSTYYQDLKRAIAVADTVLAGCRS